jgi:calpain-15
MAKLNGSYESLVAGQTIEALATLTGYPCESIQLDDEDVDLSALWPKLVAMKEAGYALGASCGKSTISDDRVFTARGLLPRHAYSIIDIKHVHGNQLIQLRNPWGKLLR